MAEASNSAPEIHGQVLTFTTNVPIIDAEVCVLDREKNFLQCSVTNESGMYSIEKRPPGAHYLTCYAFDASVSVELKEGREYHLTHKKWNHSVQVIDAATGRELKGPATVGKPFVLHIENPLTRDEPQCPPPPGVHMFWVPQDSSFTVTALDAGLKEFVVTYTDRTTGERSGANAKVSHRVSVPVAESVQSVRGQHSVRLERTFTPPTRDEALWAAIRARTHAIHFRPYQHFINRVFAHYVLRREKTVLRGHLPTVEAEQLEQQWNSVKLDLHDVQVYEILQLATDAFLLAAVGVKPDGRPTREMDKDYVTCEYVDAKLDEYLGPSGQLPYISRVLHAAFPEFNGDDGYCFDRVLTCEANEPCLIELIWSYWLEEGMLAQTMNAISRRFQNVHAPGGPDRLAHLEIDPIRPLNNVIWGWAGHELDRLSIRRRAYEYEHEYGLSLYGRAVRGVRPADTRSKFLEAFHNLLYGTWKFYGLDQNTTVIAEGYSVLNALKEVHLILAQGAHNQFRDLPWVARREMMMQQWILARPEIRDFLQSRMMVPYKEAWMPQVDTMKSLQGWTDVTVTHFRDLAVYGEEILLSVRYGDWIGVNDENSAKNWARFWRPEIQAYLHAYRAVTGVDLTNPDTVDATVPAVHLQRRLAIQQGAR